MISEPAPRFRRQFRLSAGNLKARLRSQKLHSGLAYNEIMDGAFNGSLVDVSSKSDEFAQIRQIAKERIFKAARKTELEVYGRNVVYRVFDELLPLLNEARTAD